MALAHLVAHSLERLTAVHDGVEALRHRLAGQIDQQVPNEGKELDQVSVAVDDRMVELGPDAPNPVRRLVVGHLHAPSRDAVILRLRARSKRGRLATDWYRWHWKRGRTTCPLSSCIAELGLSKTGASVDTIDAKMVKSGTSSSWDVHCPKSARSDRVVALFQPRHRSLLPHFGGIAAGPAPT